MQMFSLYLLFFIACWRRAFTFMSFSVGGVAEQHPHAMLIGLNFFKKRKFFERKMIVTGE